MSNNIHNGLNNMGIILNNKAGQEVLAGTKRPQILSRTPRATFHYYFFISSLRPYRNRFILWSIKK